MAQVDFRCYARRFKHPLQTHHGQWSHREGLILRLTTETGGLGWGEIAPIPWLGSETLQAALTFCGQRGRDWGEAAIASIPDDLPACQFGLTTAWAEATSSLQSEQTTRFNHPARLSYLLPAGAIALTAWKSPYEQGFRTFKWKIGMADPRLELHQGLRLLQQLPPDCRLRLDANGGLTEAIAQDWLRVGDDLAQSTSHAQLEFLEQPLPPSQFERMKELSELYQTAIALDESIGSYTQLEHCYRQGWRGVVVIKPAIAGSPCRLRDMLQTVDMDVVWSSALEAAIARQAIQTQLLDQLPPSDRALGFGVSQWFEDDWDQLTANELWDTLPPM